MALNNKLRSEVFARDKALCAFSGLSLWLLDYGASAHSNFDWADHIRPASRGGKDSVDNLVTASFFFNSKKRNNGADNTYLFRGGGPTTHFFWAYGCLTSRLVEDMLAHAAIVASDWYFNRAWANLTTALYNEYVGATRERSPAYWQKAALARLIEWKAVRGAADFTERGLVRYPEAPDVKIMLSLAGAESLGDVASAYRAVQPYFDANTRAFEDFLDAKNPAARQRVLERAAKSKWVTEPTLAALRINAALLAGCQAATAQPV